MGVTMMEKSKKEILKVDAQKYPQLCWVLWDHVDKNVSEEEAFYAYDKNVRFLDIERMSDDERAFFDRLMNKFGKGVSIEKPSSTKKPK